MGATRRTFSRRLRACLPAAFLTDELTSSAPVYPRLLRRIRAVLIDSVLIYIVAILFWLLLLPILDAFPTPVRIAYPILVFLALEPCMVAFTGGSPGHHLMGLAITDSRSGSRIGVVRALLRFILRTLLGWLSLLLVLTTKKHQALHDLICRTNAVLVDPGSLPERERFAERVTEEPGFIYPSKIRRVFVIALYLLLSTIAMAIVSTILVSETCLLGHLCSPMETISIFVINSVWILGIGASIIFGWQARLFGCRRRREQT